ncbi:MAG: fimbrial biogenesis chaperone [Vulcanimicrobiaceae bacterium]
MNKYRAFVALGLLFWAAAMMAPAAVPAEIGGLGLVVSPAKLDLSIPAGTTYNIPITVSNSSGQMTHVQASMVDFNVTDTGNYTFERIGARPDSLLRWASINPREFDLPAGTSQMVRLTLTIPKEKLSGEYAGIVFFQTRPTRRAGAVSFSTRIATKIYASIPGTVRVDGAISKMTAAANPRGEIYRVLFRNTGNAHVYLNGSLQILRAGTTVERVAMPAEMLVERGGDRLIELTGKRLPPGKYRAIATIDYGGKSMTGGEIVFDAR